MQPDDLVLIEDFFRATSLALPRLLALFLVVPIFSDKIVTGLVRNGVILVLAVFVSPLTMGVPSMALGEWILVLGKEAFIGVLLGLGFGLFVWAIQSVGDLIDFQTGSGNAAFFDPVSGHENGPTGELLGWLVITLFIAGGGLVAMVGVVIDSYQLWPVTSYYPKVGPLIEQFVIHQGDTLFTWIVKLGAPVITILVLVELGMGLVGRVAPQLNVFTFTQPLKSLLANFMLLLFLVFLYESLRDFLRPDNSALQFLRRAL